MSHTSIYFPSFPESTNFNTIHSQQVSTLFPIFTLFEYIQAAGENHEELYVKAPVIDYKLYQVLSGLHLWAVQQEVDCSMQNLQVKFNTWQNIW